MEESIFIKRLENVDKELHSIMTELKNERPRMTLKELRRIMKSSVKYDIDTTKLIRKMRDKKYDL